MSDYQSHEPYRNETPIVDERLYGYFDNGHKSADVEIYLKCRSIEDAPPLYGLRIVEEIHGQMEGMIVEGKISSVHFYQLLSVVDNTDFITAINFIAD